MIRVFVFTNHKGGVGKSTSATNIALGITRVLKRANASNCRVLLIDTDSQGHASLVTTGRKDYGADDCLYTVLMADRQNAPQTLMNCIVPSQWDEDLHVLPASPMLEGAERELMGVAGAPYRLADPLGKIAGQYAAVVIDTRPSFSLMTEMGLLASTDAIVPVERQADAISFGEWGLPALAVAGIHVSDELLTSLRKHRRVFVAFDNTPDAMQKNREIARSLGSCALIPRLPMARKMPMTG
jgi:cellulose biosynthesis protein BcsQ